jgi:hypothetical protein
MMVWTAIVGIVLWILTGRIREEIAWISQPPLYLLLASPFLFAASLTLAVTVVQFCRERRGPRGRRTG